MGNGKVKHLGVLGSVSKCEGPSTGTTAAVGKKTTGTIAGSLAGTKHLLARPVDEELDIDLDEQGESALEAEQEAQSRYSGDDESAGIVTRLEANLTRVRSRLAEMQEQAGKTKSELSAQITDLQTQRDSLIFDLEQTTKEVNDSKSIEATLRARVATLELELDVAKGKSEKPCNPVIHAKPQLLSDAEIDQAGQEFQLYKQKQDEIAGMVNQNQEISEKISHPEGDVKVEKTIDEQLPQPLVDEPDVSVLEDVEVAETEQVELPQQQEVESSIETTTVQSDEQEQAETEIKEFIPTTAMTEASVLPDVTFEEVKTADFTSVTEKMIFIKALSDINSQDEATRINAVKTMGGIRHEFSVRTIAAQMTSEPEAQIRAECIKALAALNMKEGLPVIERALTEQAVSVRLAAVRGLYRLGGAESAPALVRMLYDENVVVRRRTATCIRWLSREGLAVELDDSSVSVGRAAVKATAVTDASVLPDVTFEEAKTANFASVTEKVIFIKALSGINSQDEATRINAVKTMGGIRHEFSVRTIAAQMTSEPEAQIRAECIKALAALNMKEGLPVIERALTEQAVSVRLAAVRGLYRLGGAESAPALVRMLYDENVVVRRRTATCICWLGRKSLAVELVPLLDDSSVSVRRAAVEAMGNLRSRKVVSDLIEHLSDPEKRVRRAITAALKTITGKKMSEPFPIGEKSFRLLVARWQQWWKDESKVLC